MTDTLPCNFCDKENPLSYNEKHFAAEGGRVGGRSRSVAKQQASRENGKKGGRPKKH